MWTYSDTVRDHFFNPRNAGALPGANAVGEVGSISGGDALKLMLRINPETEVIEEARFQTFGCGSAIASSSALTEMVTGRTVEEARALTNRDIIAFLGGLPPEKLHCSVMGQEALSAAMARWRGEDVVPAPLAGTRLVCRCAGVDAATIERVVRDKRITRLSVLTAETRAGSGCHSCREPLDELLADINAAMVAEGLIVAAEAHVFGQPENPPRPASRANS